MCSELSTFFRPCNQNKKFVYESQFQWVCLHLNSREKEWERSEYFIFNACISHQCLPFKMQSIPLDLVCIFYSKRCFLIINYKLALAMALSNVFFLCISVDRIVSTKICSFLCLSNQYARSLGIFFVIILFSLRSVWIWIWSFGMAIVVCANFWCWSKTLCTWIDMAFFRHLMAISLYSTLHFCLLFILRKNGMSIIIAICE